MARLSRTFIALSLLAAAACGGSNDSPSQSPPPSGSGDTITGRERFGWTQAGSTSDAGTLQYAAYVDGTRRVLEGVTCNPAGSNLECSAPLPSMTPGRHTLELAAFYPGDTPVEGPRSAPMQLTIAGVVAGAGESTFDRSAAAAGATVVASDGRELLAEVLGFDLVDPVDLALDPSGRIFVAERAGSIRVLDRDGSTTSGDSADDLRTGRSTDAVVLSLAVAPDFEKSRFVYVLASDPDRGGVAIIRYRELAGRFGEAAIIATAPLSSNEPAGVLRFGPDGALYVGLGSRAPDGEQRRASYATMGRILRLTPDGRTPQDNPSASPIYSVGHRDPAGLAWHRARRTLWEVESGVTSDEINVVKGGGDYGWPTASGRELGNGSGAPSLLLAPGSQPTGIAVVDNERSPFNGDLVVSTAGLADLLRFEMTADGQPATDEPVRLVQGRFGSIGQVAADAEGALYFVTRNRALWGEGNDILVRLRPLR